MTKKFEMNTVPRAVYAGGFTDDDNPDVTLSAYYPNGEQVKLVLNPEQAATLISGWSNSIARSTQNAS